MKKSILVICLFLSGFVYSKDYAASQIETVLNKYGNAIEYVEGVSKANLSQADFLNFFNKFDFLSDVNICQLEKVAIKTSKMASHKKYKDNSQLFDVSTKLNKLYFFVTSHRDDLHALAVVKELEHFYANIDEHQERLADKINNRSQLYGLPSHGALRHLVKKINLDLRRIKHLFASYTIKNETAVSLNNLKMKLFKIKNAVVATELYASQVRMVRVYKALAILLPVLLLPVVALPVIFAYGLAITGIVITVQEMQEAKNYNIPVHSTSMFSLFAPRAWPLTWVKRG